MASWFPSMVEHSPDGEIRQWVLSVNDRGECVVQSVESDGKAGDFAVSHVAELAEFIAEKLCPENSFVRVQEYELDANLCATLFPGAVNKFSEAVAVLNGKSSRKKSIVESFRQFHYRPWDDPLVLRFIVYDSELKAFKTTPKADELDAMG